MPSFFVGSRQKTNFFPSCVWGTFRVSDVLFFLFFFVCFFLPLFFGKCLKNHRVKNTRAFFGEIQSTLYRYKNEKVRAFDEDDDEDDDSRFFFFFGFFSKRRAMMTNNKTLEFVSSEIVPNDRGRENSLPELAHFVFFFSSCFRS